MTWNKSILGTLNFAFMLSIPTILLSNIESAQIVCREIHNSVLLCTVSLVQCCLRALVVTCSLNGFQWAWHPSLYDLKILLKMCLKGINYVIPIYDCMHLIVMIFEPILLFKVAISLCAPIVLWISRQGNVLICQCQYKQVMQLTSRVVIDMIDFTLSSYMGIISTYYKLAHDCWNYLLQ